MSDKTNPKDIKEGLRKELEGTRLAYHALLEELDDSVLDQPSVNPAWNIGQVLYHITTAHQFLPQDVRIFRGGRMITPPDWLFNFINVWFTRLSSMRRDRRSLAKLYDERHRTVMKTLAGIQDDEWGITADSADRQGFLGGGMATLADMFHYLTTHYDEHEADIRESLVRLDR